VIVLVGRQSHSPLLQLKIDPVRQMGPPYTRHHGVLKIVTLYATGVDLMPREVNKPVRVVKNVLEDFRY